MSKTVEDIGTLKINLLSQAQYDAEKAGGRLADDELYLTPSSGTGVSDVEVNGSSVVSGGVAEIELKTINQNSIVGSGNIDIQGGAGVFVAEYEVTPYADIRDAILDGQSVICLMQDGDLMITLALADYDFDYGLIDFSVLAQSMGNYVSVYSNDEWASAVFTIATTDTATQLRNGLMSALDWQKLDGIESGAEVNVQSDWNQATSTADDYIKNKPTIPTVNDATLTIQKNGTPVNTFTANASSNVTANITVPTDTGDLTNGAGYVTSSALPTKVSDLTNDAGYITGYTETDPTVPSWAKQVSKPSYTASEVGALPDTTPIPSKTSDLNNDSGFITGVTSTSTPTASTISEFDSSAKMNSTDMSSADVSAFVAGLNTGVSDYVQRSEMPMYMPAWAQIYATSFTANNTATQVTGTTVTYSDNASEYFTLGTDQITIKKAGLYKINIAWILSSATNNTNVKRIALYKNGAESFAVLGRDSSYENRSSFSVQLFEVGDILTMWKRAEDNNSTYGHGRIFIETLRPEAE